MTDHTALIARVAARNPVPNPADPPAGLWDLDVVHRQVRQRETMVKTEERLVETTRPARPRAAWVAAVAFAVVIVVGAVVLFVGGGGDEVAPVVDPTTTTEAPTITEATTTTEAPTTTPTAGELTDEALVSRAEDMIEAHNSGDLETWRAFFAEAPALFGEPATTDEDWEFQRSFLAANEQWVLTGDCGVRPGFNVECPLELRNDFMAPAGLFFTVRQMQVSFDAEGSIISLGSAVWEIQGTPEDYFAAFDAWLAEAHPDVHAAFGDRVGDPLTGDNWGALPRAADMATALQYVDEFLAQSEVYPITE